MRPTIFGFQSLTRGGSLFSRGGTRSISSGFNLKDFKLNEEEERFKALEVLKRQKQLALDFEPHYPFGAFSKAYQFTTESELEHIDKGKSSGDVEDPLGAHLLVQEFSDPYEENYVEPKLPLWKLHKNIEKALNKPFVPSGLAFNLSIATGAYAHVKGDLRKALVRAAIRRRLSDPDFPIDTLFRDFKNAESIFGKTQSQLIDLNANRSPWYDVSGSRTPQKLGAWFAKKSGALDVVDWRNKESRGAYEDLQQLLELPPEDLYEQLIKLKHSREDKS